MKLVLKIDSNHLFAIHRPKKMSVNVKTDRSDSAKTTGGRLKFFFGAIYFDGATKI